MKKIVLDAGHGYNTSGKRTPGGVREWTLNDAVCRHTAAFLAEYDVEVIRCDDVTGKTDIPLIQRTNAVNSIMPDLFISVHHNAAGNGSSWTTATGVEVYSHPNKPKRDADLAKLLADEMSNLTGLRNRGAKRADFHMVRETKSTIPSILVEGGMMDSTIDEPVITSERGQKAYAHAVANVCISYLDLHKKATAKPDAVITDPPVLSGATATLEQAKAWAKSLGAADIFLSLADIYWRLAHQHGGVNPAVAYAQSGLETGYGRFGGVVPISFCNPMGSKTSTGTSDTDPSHHQRFSCWDEGVTAHLDKLALYGGAAGYPLAVTPDPRHFPYLYAQGKTVRLMANRYCPGNPKYADTLISLLNMMENTSSPSVSASFKAGDRVKVMANARDYDKGVLLKPFVYVNTYDVLRVDGDRVVIGFKDVGTTAAMHSKDLVRV